MTCYEYHNGAKPSRIEENQLDIAEIDEQTPEKTEDEVNELFYLDFTALTPFY